jgi:membrane protease YdiL (CAAX protease family)
MIWMVFLSFAGILLFAGFIHRSLPLQLLAFAGILGAGAIMGASIRDRPVPGSFGIGRLDRKMFLYTIPAIALGISLGILTRNRFELTLMPRGLTGVAIVAPLVGASEELVFRGYYQGQLRAVGKSFSVICASALHSFYKLLLILSLGTPLQFDFFFLIFWTFMGGLLFGILRELSRSAIPPILAHALYDILLYGGLSTAPVWVWS